MKTLAFAASILISSTQALETNDVHKNTLTVTNGVPSTEIK